MSDDRRLIEAYLPIEAISAEASGEKSVRKEDQTTQLVSKGAFRVKRAMSSYPSGAAP